MRLFSTKLYLNFFASMMQNQYADRKMIYVFQNLTLVEEVKTQKLYALAEIILLRGNAFQDIHQFIAGQSRILSYFLKYDS